LAALSAGEDGGGAGPAYTARLLIACPDRSGIVAAVSGFLVEREANIVSSHQYSSDPAGGRFFMRTEFFLAPGVDRAAFAFAFAAEVAERFGMDWKLRWWGERDRTAILVSRQDHCLLDLLWRRRRGELDMDVVCVISNHETLRPEVEAMGVQYHMIPVTPETKAHAEERAVDLLAGNVDLVILARYMQILSGSFLDRVGCPVLNIHHSFLPAFVGQNPYARAHERGVKLIGATAHYATADLDEGPIIEQDVQRVWHVHDADDLTRVGRDVERVVLARAVRWHLEHRVLVHENRTVVFLS
jgi:formyltetrahydrofolate deformylase